jgi:hypothetical protein
MARIIEKNKDSASGWWYLKEIIEKVLLMKCHKEGIKAISARLESKGGEKAFEEFKKRTPAGADYAIIVENYSGKIEVKKYRK